jgi:hypothetical protein
MKKILMIIIIILAVGVGYILGVQKVYKSETATSADMLKQQRLLTYRQECQNEWTEKGKTVDEIVQGLPNITKEQAQNVAKNAGIADENGYIIDEDIWVKNCIDRKLIIFE